MTLIPTARLEKMQSFSSPDAELKLMKQEKYRKKLYPPNISTANTQYLQLPNKNVSPGLNRIENERVDMFQDHISKNNDRIKIDEKTNEMVFDGRVAAGSDARKLVSNLVSSKKTLSQPKGWKELKNILSVTNAPTDIYGRSWNTNRRKKSQIKDWQEL